jgi:hypothetical protein
MQFTLKIFDSSPSTLAALRKTFEDSHCVEVVKTERVLYLEPPAGLDVLYLTLPATERWRVKPMIHKSQIVATSVSDQQKGLPPYIATGTLLAENDPRGAMPETSLLISAVLQAIRDFNESDGNRIHIVGFWAVDILRMVNPSELRMILKDKVPELGLA